jgi:4-aminobutyrate aminotransferase
MYCANDFIEDYALKTMADPADVAGLIVEPVQSDAGDIVPPPGYLDELKKLADKYELSFVVDEVKVGFGRTGKMFAVQHSRVVPDVVVVGKPIGSGMPLSAVVCKAPMLDSMVGTHLLTTGGNPVSCAAGLTTIEVIEKEKLAENASKVGDYMKKRLLEMAKTHQLIGDVRGLGLIIGVELVKNKDTKEPASKEAAKLCYGAWKRGLVTVYVGMNSNVIEITPPLILTVEQAEKGLQIFDQSLADVEAGKVPDSEVSAFAGW